MAPQTKWAAPRGRMHRAFKGLYGNRMIQFGNKISFAENKSRRTWKPNVQVKSMWSDTLGRMLRFRMTTYAMRCVRKAGSIDNYLLKTRDSEIKFPRALELKQEIKAIRAAVAQGEGELPPGGPGHSSSETSADVPGPLAGSQKVAFRTAASLSNATLDPLRMPGVHTPGLR